MGGGRKDRQEKENSEGGEEREKWGVSREGGRGGREEGRGKMRCEEERPVRSKGKK